MARNVLRTLTNVNTNAWTEWLDGVMCMKIGGVIRVYGGWNGFDVPASKNSILELNELTGALTDTGHTLPRNVHGCGFGVRSDGKGLIIGGDINTTNPNDMKEVTLIDSDGVTQSFLSSQAFLVDRILFGCVVDGMNVYIFGGQKLSDVTQGFDDVWKSTDGGLTFSQIVTGVAFLNGNMYGQVAKFRSRFYVVMPGRYADIIANRTYSLDVWSSADGITWVQETNFDGQLGAQYCNLITWDNLLWLVNGSQENPDLVSAGNTQMIYQFNGSDWSRIQATPAAGQQTHATGLCVSDTNELWIILGNTSTYTSKLSLTDIG